MNGSFYKNYKFYSFCSLYDNYFYICQNDVNYINDKLNYNAPFTICFHANVPFLLLLIQQRSSPPIFLK